MRFSLEEPLIPQKSHDDLLKIRSWMLAYRADEVLGQFLPNILVATDNATPYSLAISGLSHRLGLRLDMLLVVIIGGRGHVRKHLHFGDRANKEEMGAEIDNLLHLDGEEGVGAARHSQRAVADTAAFLEVGELIDLASALETEVLEEFKVSRLADDGSRKAA